MNLNKMGLNRFDYKTDYIKFLAVALSSDAVVMDQGLKEMFEKQIIDMFREPDMYADLFMFKKFILGNPDIDDKVKKELLESIWGSDEEYDDMNESENFGFTLFENSDMGRRVLMFHVKH